MEQIFRIEIPVEAIDKTDAAALQRLETALQKIINGMKQNRLPPQKPSMPSTAQPPAQPVPFKGSKAQMLMLPVPTTT